MTPSQPINRDVAERAFARVADRIVLDVNGCWLWPGATTPDGYGKVNIEGRHLRTHRVAFALFRGALPEGLHTDHLCRVRHCMNPWHLELVGNRENMLRGNHPNAVAHRTDRCKRGHSLADAYFHGGRRSCRPCTRLRYERKKNQAGRPRARTDGSVGAVADLPPAARPAGFTSYERDGMELWREAVDGLYSVKVREPLRVVGRE